MASNPRDHDQEVLQRQQESEGPRDSSLMEAVVGRDEQALMVIYDRYSRLVYGIAFHVLRDASSAEDVSQEVFLQLWRQPGAYDPQRGALSIWITAIARYRAIDEMRRRQKLAQLSWEASSSGQQAHNQPDTSRDIESIRSLFKQLPASQRVILELAYFGGLSHSEIALRTGQALGTIKSRLRLALLNLRGMLLRNGSEQKREAG